MKTTFFNKFLFSIAFITLLTIPNDANAWLFLGSEKKDQLEQANKTYELAIDASKEGRASDAIVLFSDARGQYSSILNTYPEYETEHVTERLNVCSQQMKIIKDKIISGEISIPSVDGVVTDANNGPTNRKNEETIFNESSINSSKEATTATKINEDTVAPKASSNYSYSSNNPLANADEATRVRLINSMLDTNKTTDAIFYMDEIIEVEGESTPLSIRCLYVKALIAVGNKTMAQAQLDTLKKIAPNDPSVLSLSAALAVANGDAMDAMLQLDKLIERNPNYAEARVNFAYLLLMMDPTTHRNAAIDSYKLALKLGAKRDPNLEKNLNIIMR